MEWKPLLHGTLEYQYGIADKLLDLVSDNELNWKPATGKNWMTVGQLLHHVGTSCGMPIKGFVTGDWGMPDGADMSKLSEEDMMPPAEKMPGVASVAEAKKMLAEDKKLAFHMLGECSESQLASQMAKAPWDAMELPLGHRMLQMAEHLNQHKGQLFYYLKLQGKPVHTGHLWGGV